MLVATFTRPRPALGTHVASRHWRSFISSLQWNARPAKRILASEQRKARRQETSREILDAFKLWLEELAPRVLPKSALATAIGYTRRQWAALERYLGDGELVPDNSASERARSWRCSRPQELALRRERRRRCPSRQALQPHRQRQTPRARALRLPARTLRAAPEPPSRPTPRTRASGLGGQLRTLLRRRRPTRHSERAVGSWADAYGCSPSGPGPKGSSGRRRSGRPERLGW